MNGFINLLKPSGISSAAVINKCKRLVYPNKIGHMGTLDVGACGVLVAGVGKATRLFDFMLAKKKKYRAVFVFAVTTPTLDSYSTICDKASFVYNEAAMKEGLRLLSGKIQQMPPIYSAKHVGGKRAYDLARQGVEFELSAKEVEVYSFDFVKRIDENSFMFDIECSGGTYIRSLCESLAKHMGTIGYMASLIRLSCGNFDLQDSVLIGELDIQKHLLPIDAALAGFPSYEYEDSCMKNLINGVGVYCPKGYDQFLIKCQGEIIGISKSTQDGEIKVGVNLR